jgi:FkbM family methyltransferase
MNAAASWPREVQLLRIRPIASLLPASPQACHHSSQGVRTVARTGGRLRRMLSRVIGRLAAWLGPGWRAEQVPQTAACTAFVREHLAQFEALYARLANRASQDVLLALLRTRMFADPWVVQHDSQHEWQRRRLGAALVERETRKPWQPHLNRYCLTGVGGKLVVQSDERTMLQTLLYEAFAYDRDGVAIRAQPGDTVIDGGSHHGASTVYFADRVRPSGHVYAVELDAGNVELIGENLVLNPPVRDSVTVIERALCDGGGGAIPYRPRDSTMGPVRIDQWGELIASTPTVTIDELVEDLGLHRVDFIKLDLGGWERRALAGARRTLSRFRPALAVSVAQRLEDLIDLPSDLDRMVAGYELFLDDVSLHGDRPMIFARHAAAPGSASR